MYWTRQKGITFLQFPALRRLKGVFHGVFLRFAGNGRDGSDALNLGLNCGDAAQTVWRNRRRITALLGGRHMVLARQVHGVKILGWHGNPRQAGTETHDNGYTILQADALATDIPRQALFIQVADCQPVLLVDPVGRVVANVHSGWRGSIGNIAGDTVAFMQEAYGCSPGHILAGIGPSLGPCCAEFIHYRQEIPAQFWSYRLAGDHFDFWRLSVDQLVAAGLARENISQSRICTRCNQHLLYSYRGERHTGRFAAVVGLSPLV
jgi:YfiH family protein